jgi:hypothetical protein
MSRSRGPAPAQGRPHTPSAVHSYVILGPAGAVDNQPFATLLGKWTGRNNGEPSVSSVQCHNSLRAAECMLTAGSTASSGVRVYKDVEPFASLSSLIGFCKFYIVQMGPQKHLIASSN